jgi:energy-coupling factor transporter ATP-binding protein EcfA2
MNMVHLESLSLKHFRGFDRLEIDGFSKVNVLLGKNNCGKTSILEAIFLLSGMANPLLVLNINAMRGIQANKETLRYFFHNFDTEEQPFIAGEFSGNISRKLGITPVYESSKLNTAPLSTSHTAVTSMPSPPKLSGLDFSFSIKRVHEEEKLFKTWLRFEPNGALKQKLSSSYVEDVLSTFLYAEDKDNGLNEKLATLIVDKKEHLINDLLNKFDGTLKGIYPLPNGIYLDKEGLSERMPLNLMGRGICHFLNMAATLATNKEKNFICLIDEIENGLHHETQHLLWQSLFSLIRNSNVQLFITTHSLEILQSLNSVLATDCYKDVRDEVKVFTIANTKKAGFQSYGISYEGLESAIENENELRS